MGSGSTVVGPKATFSTERQIVEQFKKITKAGEAVFYHR